MEGHSRVSEKNVTTTAANSDSRVDRLGGLYGGLACAVLYVSIRSIQILSDVIAAGLHPRVGGEALLAVAVVVSFVLPYLWSAPAAVAVSLAIAQTGLVRLDFIAVVCVVLLAGFKPFRYVYGAAAIGIGYLLIAMNLPGQGAVFLDAALIFATATLSALVQAVIGHQRHDSANVEHFSHGSEEGTKSLADREQLAAEIHDAVGHYLAAIQAVGHGAAASSNEDVKRLAAEKIQSLAGQAQLCTRNLVDRLSSEDGGTGYWNLSTLPTLVKQAIPVHIHPSISICGVPHSRIEERLICRLVIEAVTNALRHAEHMHHIEVSVSIGEGAADVLVRNDGIMSAPPSRLGGLGRLRDEVHSHGGTITFGSEPGGGWMLVARVLVKSH